MIGELALTFALSGLLGTPAQDPAKAPPPPPPPPAAQDNAAQQVKRVKVGGKVAQSRLLHRVEPLYPSEAREKKIQGTVRLHVILSKDGTVQQVKVVSGDPILAKAAEDAVREWRYKPTLLNGELVEVDTTVDVVFALTE